MTKSQNRKNWFDMELHQGIHFVPYRGRVWPARGGGCFEALPGTGPYGLAPTARVAGGRVWLASPTPSVSGAGAFSYLSRPRRPPAARTSSNSSVLAHLRVVRPRFPAPKGPSEGPGFPGPTPGGLQAGMPCERGGLVLRLRPPTPAGEEAVAVGSRGGTHGPSSLPVSASPRRHGGPGGRFQRLEHNRPSHAMVG